MLFLDHYSSLTISFLTPLVKAAQEAGKGALMRFHKAGQAVSTANRIHHRTQPHTG